MAEDIRILMEESPVGGNHGVAVDAYVDEGGAVQVTRRDLAGRLALVDQKGLDTGDSRFGIVSSRADGGLVAHRGVLHPDEYVDTLALREAVLAELGVTYPEFTGAYGNGRPTAEQRQQRAEIDARLLALSRAGTNLAQLASALGVSEKTLDRALIRARDADVEPMVATGVVRTRHACFKCGEPGKKRKRRFSDSPEPWVTTIALCDEHYRASFETRKGNPGYWAFRSRLAIPAGAR